MNPASTRPADNPENRPHRVARVFPLPDPSVCGPALVIKPHRNTTLVQSREPEIANWGEL